MSESKFEIEDVTITFEAEDESPEGPYNLAIVLEVADGYRVTKRYGYYDRAKRDAAMGRVSEEWAKQEYNNFAEIFGWDEVQ